MSDYTEKFDSDTVNVIDYLKTRPEICDLNIEELPGINKNLINEWEIKNCCHLPEDLKAFYLNHNGMLIQWKVKVDNNTILPLGRLQINSLKDLTKVGSVLNKDYSEPSIFDLDDLQTIPKHFTSSSKYTQCLNNSTSSSSLSSTESPTFSQSFKRNEQFEEPNNDCSDDDFDDEDEKFKDKLNAKTFLPHFDDTSKNFEIDNCNGFGKVCLVYRNSKSGTFNSEHSSEFWFLDRSFQWHYLTNSFKNYYRLSIAHLGLPQWQMLFTEDGLPPFLYQWYYLFAPGRILIHQDNWKKLEFLSLLENSNAATNQNANIKRPQQQQQVSINNKKKIDFTKLFDDKNQKSKALNQNNSASSNIPNNNQTDKTSSNPKAKSKIIIKK